MKKAGTYPLGPLSANFPNKPLCMPIESLLGPFTGEGRRDQAQDLNEAFEAHWASRQKSSCA
jgi:hypothetical protein